MGRFNGQGLDNFHCSKEQTIHVAKSSFQLVGEHCDKKGVVSTIVPSTALNSTEDNTDTSQYEIWMRITADEEFIRLIVHIPTGVIVGAMIISDTSVINRL